MLRNLALFKCCSCPHGRIGIACAVADSSCVCWGLVLPSRRDGLLRSSGG